MIDIHKNARGVFFRASVKASEGTREEVSNVIAHDRSHLGVKGEVVKEVIYLTKTTRPPVQFSTYPVENY